MLSEVFFYIGKKEINVELNQVLILIKTDLL